MSVSNKPGDQSPDDLKQAARARKLGRVAETLTFYSALPDEALVNVDVVCAVKGRSPASIWRDVRAGRCPAPVKAGPRCTRWRVGDLRATAFGCNEESGEVQQ